MPISAPRTLDTTNGLRCGEQSAVNLRHEENIFGREASEKTSEKKTFVKYTKYDGTIREKVWPSGFKASEQTGTDTRKSVLSRLGKKFATASG